MKTKPGLGGFNLLASLFLFAAIHTEIVTSQTVRWSIEAPNSGTKVTGSRLITSYPMTSSVKTSIVNAHNTARSSVNPPPADMRKITWDDELETLAVAYAKKCIFAINREKKLPRFQRVEENIYVSQEITFGNQYASQAVGRWNEEGKYYNYQTNKCTAKDRCKRYTQMVWGPTFKVGCGISKCSAIRVGRQVWRDATIMVCDYVPGGNWITRRPYETGKVCSKCHETDTCVDNLCTNRARDLSPRPAAVWSQWSAWTTCSQSCGIGGTRRRNRFCSTFVDRDCGRNTPSKGFDFSCSRNIPCTGGTGVTAGPTASWGRWDNWSTCSASCGGGQISRTRSCSSGRLSDCKGSNIMSFPCNGRPCPRWNNWRTWEGCTSSCGGGTRIRTRACNSGTDSDCQGSSSESGACNTQRCQSPTSSQGSWGAWLTWGSCSATCGSGTRTRSRKCSGTCRTGIATSRETCTKSACTAPARLSQWTQWSGCSRTCGSGTSTRTRRCIKPQGSTASCQGSTSEQKTCQRATCPAKRSWSLWNNWGSCSVTCGTGSQARTRTCSAGSGPTCPGLSRASRSCRRPTCPTLSAWTTWSSCSVTCGSGQQSQTRSCSTRRDSDCPGLKRNSRSCSKTACTTSKWNLWQTWGSCSTTCGSGTQTRVRTCNLGNSGGGCSGSSRGTRNCNVRTCPTLSSWTRWSSCSVTCGSGQQEQTRSCSSGRNSECLGLKRNTRTCTETACTTSTWGTWATWSKCSRSCGSGSRSRSRTCNLGNTGPTCQGSSAGSQVCNPQKCPTFSKWTTWSRCSKTCGPGTRSRSRRCSSGRTTDCGGDAGQSESCNDVKCTVSSWTQWTAWTSCTKTCGRGNRQRERTCNKGNSGPTCAGQGKVSMICNSQTCPSFGGWSQWNKCSAVCGTGEQTRTRTCSTGKPQDCQGDSEDRKVCNKPTCQNSKWAPWGSWTQCSLSCGGGQHSRKRTCDEGNSGPTCTGVATDSGKCNTQSCPTFLTWQTWSACSVTCGSGTRSRSRSCSTGILSDCAGNPTASEACTKTSCSLSAWGSWGMWSSCSHTCGTGSKSRTRMCIIGNSGPPCQASRSETDMCNAAPCPAFSPWSNWSKCPVTCGVGMISRSRACNTGVNSDCAGNHTETNKCTKPKCAISAWSPWATWNDCTQTCGIGTQTRSRVCNRGSSGSNCPGSSTDQQNCNAQACPLFSSWTPWSTCSATCGRGQLSKTRTCSTKREKDCIGPTIMLKACNAPVTCATSGNSTANPNNDKQFGGGTTTTSNSHKFVYSVSLLCASILVSFALSS